MLRGKTLLANVAIISVLFATMAPLMSQASDDTQRTPGVDRLIKMRQLQNEQVELKNIKLQAHIEKQTPTSLKVMQQARMQKSIETGKPGHLGHQFDARLRMHREGDALSADAFQVNRNVSRDVSGGSGTLSLADQNLHYFNFSTGMTSSDTTGMDVNITGNEGVNFGSESWDTLPDFSNPSQLFYLLAQGSLNDIIATPMIDDPTIPWTTISWDWNGGGNNGQPLAIGNIWAIYTRTTHCYVVMEVTDVNDYSFSFDYLYQSDGSNVFGELLPMTMTVNGMSADTLETGSNPYFEFTTPDPGPTTITAFWDRDHNGLPTEGDIPIDEWQAIDGDMHDENPDPGIFGFTYSDEMADGLNYVADDWIFVAQNGPQFASVAVTFFQIETGYRIYGNVTNGEIGEPIEGIIVWVNRYDNNNNDNGPDVIAITDANGAYELFVPDTGRYWVGSFDHLMVTDGLLPTEMQAEVNLTGPSYQQDFTYLNPQAFISGQVTDELGVPVAGIAVYADGNEFSTLSYTNEEGFYQNGVVPDQYYWVGVDGQSAWDQFMIPPDQEVWAGFGTTVHDITLVRPNDTITGSLILDGAPWQNILVFAWNDVVGVGVGFSDGAGNFSIPVFSPAENGYYLDIQPEGPMDNLVKISFNNNVPPGSSGQIIEYETVNGGIEGYCYDASSNEIIYHNVGVNAFNLQTGQGYFASPEGSPDGMYRMYLPDGLYAISAGGPNYLMTPPDTIAINSALVWYDFYLNAFQYDGAVEGYVYNANDNSPIPNADVWIGAEVWGNYTQTDGNGFYHFDTPNGRFDIVSGAPGFETFWDSVWVNNDVVTHDFYLNPFTVGGTLMGTTFGRGPDGNSTPLLPWTDISIDSWEYSFYVQSDYQGHYSIDLPEGVYQVEAYHDGYFPVFVDSIWVSGNITLDLYLDSMIVDGAVFGHVFDEDTQMPIPDAEVILFIPESPIGYQTWTNGNGDYWLDVQNGEYWLMVNAPNYQPFLSQNVFVNSDTVQVDVALQAFDGSIYGTVTDAASNQPLSDASIYIQSRLDSTQAYYTNSDWDGNYHVGLPNGEYDVFCGRYDYDVAMQPSVVVADNDVNVNFMLNYHTWATPPEIRWVRDVPDDQGRWVRLRFSANSTDWGPYQGFSVWRSHEIPSGTVWDFVDYIPFHDQDAYSLVVPTLVDSNATTGTTGDFWSTFVVTGHADMWNFFDSAPGSGYSIDNIVPGVPQNVAVTSSTPAGVSVQWDASFDDDFQYFCVYRSETADFTGVNPILQTETTFNDGNVQIGHIYYYRVKAVDANGNHSNASNTVSSMIVSVSEEAAIPTEFGLDQNYPNPFNPSTQIRLALPQASDVTLTIYNIRGQAVRSLVNGPMHAGYLSVTWDGKDNQGNQVGSGTYLYRLNAGSFTQTHKMVLMR